MPGFCDYLENKILGHVFNNTPFAAPAAFHLALSTADPGESGAALTEPVGNGYARILVTWSTAAAGQIANSAQAQFPQASGPWGLITHFAILDAATGGNPLAAGPLQTPQSVVAGNAPLFGIGAITVSLD